MKERGGAVRVGVRSAVRSREAKADGSVLQLGGTKHPAFFLI